MNHTDLGILVQRVRGGDAGAFTELYNATYKAAYFHAKTALRNPEDIEDALQEAYVTAYQNLGRLQNPEAVAAWINQIVTFTCLHKRRRLARRETFSLDDEDFHYEPVAGAGSTPERLLDEWGTREILSRIIEQLPEAQRLTVILYYYDEMKVSQIAAMMGCSENTVKSRLNYARKNIGEAVMAEEKRGVKLYSLTPALFLAAFSRLAEKCPAASGAPVLPASLGGARAAGAAGQRAATGGRTAAARPVGSAGSRSAASRTAGAAARGSRAAAAVSTGAKVGISSRLIAGIAAAVVLLGGVGAAVAIASGSSDASENAAFVENYASVGSYGEIDLPQAGNEDPFTSPQTIPAALVDDTEDILTAAYFPDERFLDNLQDKYPDGLTRREALNVTRLSIYNHAIHDLTGIEYFPNLQELDCSKNSLETLDLSHNPALIHVDCGRNRLTTLTLGYNPALTKLECYGNQLTVLDLSHCPSLTELSCGKNQLTEINLSQNAALERLFCHNNQLRSLDLTLSPALIEAECGGNQLPSLDVSRNPALVKLRCSGNQLTTLDVSHNPALSSLSCNDNQLTSLDVSHNPALTHLECSNNYMDSVDTSNNPELVTFYCYPRKS